MDSKVKELITYNRKNHQGEDIEHLSIKREKGRISLIKREEIYKATSRGQQKY